MVSMNDIAKKLNLSRTSVSNILNNKKAAQSYKPETIAKVKKTAKEMGYIPNNMAISLMRGSTMTLAIVVPDLSNTYYVKIIKEIERLASTKGYQLYIFTSEESVTKENSILEFLSRQRVDGLLIAPVSYHNSLSSSKFVPNNIICFDRTIIDSDFKSVTIDNRKYAEQLIEKNVKLEYDKIFFMGGSEDDLTVLRRLDGVRKTLNKKEMKIDEIISEVYNEEDALRSINKILKAMPNAKEKTYLVVMSTNYFAIGVVKAFKKLGIEKVKFLGFEEVSWSDIANVDIDYIDQPITNIASSAFELLINKISGNQIKSIKIGLN